MLDALNVEFTDGEGRPFRDIRVQHTHILDDPYDDLPQLTVPDESPLHEVPEEETVQPRLSVDDPLNEDEGKSMEELNEEMQAKEAKSR